MQAARSGDVGDWGDEKRIATKPKQKLGNTNTGGFSIGTKTKTQAQAQAQAQEAGACYRYRLSAILF